VQILLRKKDVQTKLDIVPEKLEKLHHLQKMDFEKYSSDFRNLETTLYLLQTSIQALIDIGSYVIASLGLTTPDTNAEVVEILVENELLPEEKRESYISIMQLRNKVVHIYNDIDERTIYDIMQEETKDIEELYVSLLDVIEEHTED